MWLPGCTVYTIKQGSYRTSCGFPGLSRILYNMYKKYKFF